MENTTILTNVPLEGLSQMCDHKHQHTHAYDTIRVNGKSVKRSQLAGQYPWKLCASWAACASGCQ